MNWKVNRHEFTANEFFRSIIIIAIMIIRALFINKLPKNTFLILWVIALVRLLVPYTIPSTFSIYSVMQENKSNSVILLEEAENINEVTTPMNMEIVEDTELYVRCYRKFRISMPIDDDFIKEWKVEHKIKRNISFKRSSDISTPISYGDIEISCDNLTVWHLGINVL